MYKNVGRWIMSAFVALMMGGIVWAQMPKRVQMAYNYCTLSYTMALWNESDWEAEIDRLADAGFTHVLVNAGMEAVWYDFLTTKLGTVDGFTNYTDVEARKHIPHPSWRAWWLMGNLEGEGELLSADGLALSQNEILRQKRIGRTIVRKLREHGMVPVVNAFMGLLPTDFDAKYPNLTYLPQTSNWCGFVRPDQLLPTDAAFPALAKAYHAALFEVYDFGPFGVVDKTKPLAFSGDLFHEGGAKPAEDAVTTASAVAVQREMQVARPGSMWFLQHWNENPTHALKAGCDEDYTIIQRLDKDMRGWLEVTVGPQEYIGKNGKNIPWIWAELTNFGDNPNLYGSLKRMATARKMLDAVYATEGKNPTKCIGWGMLDEGISYQPVYYAEMFNLLGNYDDLKKSPHLAISTRKDAAEAWQSLLLSVYEPTQWQEGCSEGILCAEPHFGSAYGHASAWGWGGPYYDKTLVRKAGEFLLATLKANPNLATDDVWREFYIDVMRQVASDAFTARVDCRRPSLFVVLDALLLRSNRYTLDYYWQKALELSRPVNADGTLGAPNEQAALKHYRDYLCLMTIWRQDDTTNFTGLHDYSHRQLGGMMVPYYGRRWADYWAGKDGGAIRLTDAQWWKNAPIPPKAISATADDLIKIGTEILSFDITAPLPTPPVPESPVAEVAPVVETAVETVAPAVKAEIVEIPSAPETPAEETPAE